MPATSPPQSMSQVIFFRVLEGMSKDYCVLVLNFVKIFIIVQKNVCDLTSPPHSMSRHICKIRRTLCDDRDGDPCIGAVPGVSGLYMAAGHSCWGILQVPRSLGLPDLAP